MGTSIEHMLAQYGAFIVVAAFLAGIGRAINATIWPSGVPTRAAGQKGFRWFWRLTMELHPIVAGALVGLAAGQLLPVPEFMGLSRWGAVLWFATAGVFSIPIFRRVSDVVEDSDDP